MSASPLERRGGRFLVIGGLCGLAVVQPILDLLGENPTTFTINRISATSTIIFAVGVVILPLTTLWLVGEAAFALDRRAGQLLHAGIVGALCGAIAVLLIKSFTSVALVSGAAGIAALAFGAYAALRLRWFGAWSKALSVTNPLFLALFVFASPAADVIWAGTQKPIERAPDLEKDPPSVIMIVFDEWPTQSLLTADGSIDAVRFPNLSALAEESTFYRHFTTVSPFTQSAVPALLDGLDPFGGPTWADHPDSLFSLLGASHHPIVAESITDICGLPECRLRPVPPPIPAGIEASEDSTREASASEIDVGPRWGRLFDTTLDIWTERVTPGSDDGVNAFDDYVEDITFATPTSRPAVSRPDPNDGLDDDDIALERFIGLQVFGQPDRQRLFLDALQPTDVPVLGFLHLILPHQPWSLREDGTTYAVAGERENYESDNNHEWPVAVSRQRHLLQAEYADRLLGEVLRRLEEIEKYDDSIIVVVSDHGVSFEPGEPSRRVTDRNLEQIAYSPLLIKTPGQNTARVDDSNLNSTDVTPTIASLLGIAMPWEADGSPVGDARIAARGADKYIHSFSDAFDYEFLGVVEFDDTTAYAAMLAGIPSPLEADEERNAALYRDIPGADEMGRIADDVFSGTDGRAAVAALEELRRPVPDVRRHGEISGRVGDAPPDSTVLVAVNDTIIAVSPLYPRDGGDNYFAVLLPSGALDPLQNSIRLGLRAPDGSVSELTLENQ